MLNKYLQNIYPMGAYLNLRTSILECLYPRKSLYAKMSICPRITVYTSEYRLDRNKLYSLHLYGYDVFHYGLVAILE